ncbi:MAG: cation transporter [Deltaproteobacteria bacterium]|nr:cation transporter [Deltaproteobacteria bacterium]
MPVKTEEITLSLGGLHCAACVARVERALSAAPGVELARVNLATRQAKVRFNPQATNLEALTAVVQEAGYEVESAAREQRPPRSPEAEVRQFRNRFLLALILSLPVWAAMIPPVEHGLGLGHRAMNLILLACSTPVMFYSGASFFAGAWSAARHRATNMDTLVLGHLLPRNRSRGRPRPGGLFRHRPDDHHLHPVRALAGGPHPGPGLGGHPPAVRPGAAQRPGAPG